MKKSMKAELIEKVASMAIKVQAEENIYTLNINDKELFEEVVNESGKFTVVNNKKDETLKAVAYTTKKSDKFMVVRFVEVEEKEVEKKASKKSNGLKMVWSMIDDKGLSCHKAQVKIENAQTIGEDTQILEKLLGEVNEEIAKSEADYLQKATLVDVTEANGIYEGFIEFPKVKGHSKDGYAEYKKCVTRAKKTLKQA